MRQLTAPSPKLAALIHASIVGGETGFFLLKRGEHFHFPGSDEIMTKTSDLGWYRDMSGRRFRTGTATAVTRVPVSEINTDKFCPHGYTPRTCSDCSY